MQVFVARYSTSGSTFGRQPAGTVKIAREYLSGLDLREFGINDSTCFLEALDRATFNLQRKIRGRSWGFARKGLNVFLRDCLYNVFLREYAHLAQADAFFEVALDSIVAGQLRKRDSCLPPWVNIRDLTPDTNRRYQNVAAKVALDSQRSRVHLDAVWWGRG